MEKCPDCGADIVYDEVDIGVGIQRGNPHCVECNWVPKFPIRLDDDSSDIEGDDNVKS